MSPRSRPHDINIESSGKERGRARRVTISIVKLQGCPICTGHRATAASSRSFQTQEVSLKKESAESQIQEQSVCGYSHRQECSLSKTFSSSNVREAGSQLAA